MSFMSHYVSSVFRGLLYAELDSGKKDIEIQTGFEPGSCQMFFLTELLYHCKNKVAILAKYLVTTLACSTEKKFMQWGVLFE